MLSSPVMKEMVAKMVQEESAAMRKTLMEEQLRLDAEKAALEAEKNKSNRKSKAKKEPAVSLHQLAFLPLAQPLFAFHPLLDLFVFFFIGTHVGSASFSVHVVHFAPLLPASRHPQYHRSLIHSVPRYYLLCAAEESKEDTGRPQGQLVFATCCAADAGRADE